MKRHFVTYEIAVALKDINFDEDCICSFSNSKRLVSKVSYSSGKDCECKWGMDEIDDLRAPLWQQVVDWFREKHNIDVVSIPVRFTGHEDIGYWTYAIKSIQPVGKQKYKFDTSKEALKEAISKTIELINENI